MVKRAKGQVVNLRLRIRESLRARLEKDARRTGISLNAEVERRLEDSYTAQKELEHVRELLKEQRRVIVEWQREIAEGNKATTDLMGDIRTELGVLKGRVAVLKGRAAK
jgi:hypothetical protein